MVKTKVQKPKKEEKKPAKPKKPVDPEAARKKAIQKLYGKEGQQAGQALADTFYQPGALGRVTTDLGPQNDALQRMQAGLGGYTSPEYQAQREQMMKGVNSNYMTAQNQLAKAQARGKVYGAAGAAQMANLSTATQNSKNDLEQQLMVKDIDERQNRLNTYGAYAAGTNQSALEREKLNLGQLDAEVAGRIGALTGAGSTALTKAQNRASNKISEKGIDALSK